MAERIPAPADIANTNWNTDGLTYPSVDPGGAKRATGYKPKDVPVPGLGEVITANDQNYMHGLWGQMVNWVKQFIPREWEELSEGITNSTVFRQMFWVIPPSSIRSRFAVMWTQTSVATGTGSPKQICVDGEQTYYIAGTSNEYINAVSPVDGQDGAGGGIPIWEIQPKAGAQVLSLTTDGFYLYYSMQTVVTGIQRVGRDGTGLATGGVTYAHKKLRANGVNVIGIAGSTGAGDLDIWLTGALTLTATKATGSTGLNGLALDEDTAYVGGIRNGGVDVWAYPLAGGAATWTAALDSVAPTINDICTDGDYVYVATNDFVTGLPGTPNRDFFCVERVSGTVLWSLDLGSNLNACSTDDEYLYLLDSVGANLYMIRKGWNTSSGPGIVKVKSGVSTISNSTIPTDGVSIYTIASATTTDLMRISNGGVSKAFVRVSGQDPRRRPIYTLASPVSNRL